MAISLFAMTYFWGFQLTGMYNKKPAIFQCTDRVYRDSLIRLKR